MQSIGDIRSNTIDTSCVRLSTVCDVCKEVARWKVSAVSQRFKRKQVVAVIGRRVVNANRAFLK